MNKKTLTGYRKKYGAAARYLIERRRLPWVVARTNIVQRCTNKNDSKFAYYGGRGVRCLVTSRQLKAAFFRDKAWLLDVPSVDRIRPGNYHVRNIRWIEARLNSYLGSLCRNRKIRA